MAETAALLEANRAFYAALESRDPSEMEERWSHADDVTCTHPGWHRLDGWEDVSRSWEAIFANSRAWKVHPEEEHAFLSGDLGVVLCIEILQPVGGHGDPARMQATNVYRREDGLWRIVHHHASPMPEVGEDDEEDTVN
jgi:ketosteroid isomerase-like protein